MAIACLRLVTFFPLRPLFSRPRLNSCISRSTLFCALGPYLRPRLDDFFELLPLEDFERDLLRDELFLCAVAIKSSLLHYQTQSRP